MMDLRIRESETLLRHLQTYRVDGATVDSVLFEGGRMFYTGRKEIEQQLGHTEPYTLSHEARVVEGFLRSINASIRLLSGIATCHFDGHDNTLDLLWQSHAAYERPMFEGPSLDRLVAALVMVEHIRGNGHQSRDVQRACCVLVRGLNAAGFPSSGEALEEIWDGAAPACVGLGLVDIG